MKENKNQTIEGNNNEQSINKIEINIGSIQNNPNPEVLLNSLQEIFKTGTHSYPEIALKEIENRVNNSLQDLTKTILEQQIQIDKIKDLLNQPDFCFFINDAKNTMMRSDETALKSITQLIVAKINTQEGQNSIVNLTLNEAINIIPKLLPIHIKMLTINYLFKEVHFGSSSLDHVFSKYERYINMFADVIETNYKGSIYKHLESSNCVTIPNIRTTSPLLDFIYNEYIEYTLVGEDVANIPEDLQNVAKKYGLKFEYKRDLSNKVILNRKIINELQLQMTNQEREIIERHFNNKIDKTNFINQIEQKHQKLFNFAKLWDKSVLSNLVLNNVGTVIAISYLNAISPKQDQLEYSIWI